MQREIDRVLRSPVPEGKALGTPSRTEPRRKRGTLGEAIVWLAAKPETKTEIGLAERPAPPVKQDKN